MATELPDDLIELERSAWTEIQERRLTLGTAVAVYEAIAAYVSREDVEVSRLEVESELKRLVRHP